MKRYRFANLKKYIYKKIILRINITYYDQYFKSAARSIKILLIHIIKNRKKIF